MPIQVGFSSMVCPSWDLETIVLQAAQMGYDGVELRGLNGTFHLPDVPELASDPAAIVSRFADAGVQLVCLGSSASFESPKSQELAKNRRQLIETIELASKLECPFVRVFLGESAGSEHRGTLGRIASELHELATVAANHGTTILVENGGDFSASEDLWFVVDAVSHPGLRACWNPLNGRFHGEHPTTSIPRLGRHLAAIRVIDGLFDEQEQFLGYEMPGLGDVGFDHVVRLLKGVCFQGWLIFEWPRMVATLPEPEVALPRVIKYVREQLEQTQQILAAYKGDKNPPNFKAATAVAPTDA